MVTYSKKIEKGERILKLICLHTDNYGIELLLSALHTVVTLILDPRESLRILLNKVDTLFSFF